MKRRDMAGVDTIFVHATATAQEWMVGRSVSEKVAEIDRWHKERGFSGFGYHALIDRDGSVADGRSDHVVPAAVKGYNARSLNVALVGGRGGSADDDFFDHFTREQHRALRRWIAEKRERYPQIRHVRGHNEVAAKACPCFRVWEAGIVRERKSWFAVLVDFVIGLLTRNRRNDDG